jgi:hypothetical protein
MINFVGGKGTAIASIDNAISEADCRFLIDACKEHYDKVFTPGPTIGGVNTSIKNSMDFGLSEEADDLFETGKTQFRDATMFVVAGLETAMALYLEAFTELQHSTRLTSTGFRLQHYPQKSGYYRRHHDGAPWDPDPINSRVLGVVIYLNTIKQGGGTHFPEQECEIEAVAGRVGIFPSNWTHPHAGRVPISEDKWIISTFIIADRITNNQPQVIHPTEIQSYEMVEESLKMDNQ